MSRGFSIGSFCLMVSVCISMAGLAHSSSPGFKEKHLKEKLPVLLYFWAPWCGEPCKQMKQTVADVTHQLAGKIKVTPVNTYADPKLTQWYGISGLPTLVLLIDGVRISTKFGNISPQRLKRWMNRHIGI